MNNKKTNKGRKRKSVAANPLPNKRTTNNNKSKEQESNGVSSEAITSTSMMMNLPDHDVQDDDSTYLEEEHTDSDPFKQVWDKVSSENTRTSMESISSATPVSVITTSSSSAVSSGPNGGSSITHPKPRKRRSKVMKGVVRVERMVNDELIRELEIDCSLTLQDIEVDLNVFRKVLESPCMRPRLELLRQEKLVLLINGERVSIDQVQECINVLLFHYILVDCDRGNAIDTVLQDLGLSGGFIAGRSFIKPRFYDFLLRLPKGVIFEPAQHKHEHFKDSVRKAVALLGVKGGQYHVTSWADEEMINVLKTAVQAWRPDNTFIDQQIAAKENGYTCIHSPHYSNRIFVDCREN